MYTYINTYIYVGLGLVGVVPLVVSQLKTEDEEPTDYRGFSTYCGEFLII